MSKAKKLAPSSAAELKQYYSQMYLCRVFEQKAGQAYGKGLIGGFCHLYIGQEAVIVGCKAAMQHGDSLITTYRDHAHCLLSGMSAKEVMAELMGKAAGCSRGKGGSMHMFSTEHKFYGGHGIVGASVPLGTGLAFAEKYRGTDNICLTFYGDGAANQGQVYEAFNMAALWQLPVLYIIENNQYSMGTSVNRGCANGDKLYTRGEPYGITGEQVDGMDVLAVKSAVAKALKKIRNGGGPVLLEMKTYRYRGHSMSDPAKYREKSEVELFKTTQDPVDNLKAILEKQHHVSADEFKTIEKAIKAEVDEAIKFAESAPEPAESELYTDVFANE